MFKALLASLIVFSFSATHSKDTAAQKTAPCYEWSAIRADKN